MRECGSGFFSSAVHIFHRNRMDIYAEECQCFRNGVENKREEKCKQQPRYKKRSNDGNCLHEWIKVKSENSMNFGRLWFSDEDSLHTHTHTGRSVDCTSFSLIGFMLKNSQPLNHKLLKICTKLRTPSVECNGINLSVCIFVQILLVIACRHRYFILCALCFVLSFSDSEGCHRRCLISLASIVAVTIVANAVNGFFMENKSRHVD